MRSIVPIVLDYSAHISIVRQHLTLYYRENPIGQGPVNTAKNGIGFLKGSEMTPVGKHYVRAAIGTGLPALAVLRARRPTGEIWSPALAIQQPERDWILGRILWLCGLEKGINRGGNQDTFRRYIYLHGSPDIEVLTQPASHGCIRLKVDDMIYLYQYLRYGSRIDICVDS